MMQCLSPIFQLKIVVHGKPVQEYHKDGNTFVEGRQGSNFELLLKNLTGRRLLVHPTVDGLSAMTGKEASKNDSAHGYILMPYTEWRIPGWRLNDQEVAQFYFAGNGKSYAEKIGKGADKGVIACAVWEEKIWSLWNGIWQTTYHTYNPPFTLTDCAPPFNPVDIGGTPINVYHSSTTGNESMGGGGVFSASCCAGSGEVKTSFPIIPESFHETQNLGTGFGARTEHAVQSMHFETATTEPVIVAAIYYDDIRGLRNRGVRINPAEKRSSSLPNPFPRDKDCTPPDGWRG